MDPQVPGGDYPNAGLELDTGLSTHEWTTRWAEVEEARRDDEAEALSRAVDLLQEMFREFEIPADEAGTPPTEDLPARLTEIRQVRELAEADAPVTAEELDDAFASARDVFDYLIGGRDAA